MAESMQKNTAPYCHVATSQFGVGAILKLTALIAFFAAMGMAMENIHCLFFAVASIGIFLAEHFSKSRVQEFFFLIVLPTIGWIAAAVLFSASSLFGTPAPSIADGLGHFLVVVLLTSLVSVFASAISVVAVCFMCGWFYRFTGIRLLKFRWNDGESTGVAKGIDA